MISIPAKCSLADLEDSREVSEDWGGSQGTVAS